MKPDYLPKDLHLEGKDGFAKSKCIECGEIVKHGNKFCNKSACRVQNCFRRKLEPEIRKEIEREAEKKIARDVSLALGKIMQKLYSLSDYLNRKKEGL